MFKENVNTIKDQVIAILPKEGEPDYARKLNGSVNFLTKGITKLITTKNKLKAKIAACNNFMKVVVAGNKDINTIISLLKELQSDNKAQLSNADNKKLQKVIDKLATVSSCLDHGLADPNIAKKPKDKKSRKTGPDVSGQKAKVGQIAKDLCKNDFMDRIAMAAEAVLENENLSSKHLAAVKAIYEYCKQLYKDPQKPKKGGKRAAMQFHSKEYKLREGKIIIDGNDCCVPDNVDPVGFLLTKLDATDTELLRYIKQLAELFQQQIEDNQIERSKLKAELSSASINADTIGLCRTCGKIRIITDYNHAYSLSTNREFPLWLANRAMFAYVRGTPVHRILNTILPHLGIRLGTSQLLKSLKEYVFWYIAPLYFSILEMMLTCAEIVHIDETPFKVLENKGHGNLSKAQRNDPNKKVGAAEHIVTICSAARLPLQAVAYTHVAGRSFEVIKEKLASLRAKVIVCDNYSVYPKLVEYINSVKVKGSESVDTVLQSCLVHFRRAVIYALVLKKLMDETLKPSDAELIKYVEEQAKHNEAWCIFIPVLYALQGIYAVEAIAKDKGLNKEEIERKRKEYSAILLSSINTLMDENKDKYVHNERGMWCCNDNVDIDVAKAFCYYLNAAKNYSTFIYQGDVDPDNNRAERSLRCFNVLRNQVYHLGTQEGADMTVMAMTVAKTLELNLERVINPEAFLYIESTRIYVTAWQNAVNRRPEDYPFDIVSPNNCARYFADLDMNYDITQVPPSIALKKVFPKDLLSQSEWDRLDEIACQKAGALYLKYFEKRKASKK